MKIKTTFSGTKATLQTAHYRLAIPRHSNRRTWKNW